MDGQTKDLLEQVRGYLNRVEKEGENGLRALCPFHEDHAPSLSVNEEWYHCWSCGANGSLEELAQQLAALRAKALAEVLRKWVALSDEEAGVVMSFVTGGEPGKALIITGGPGRGKSWLGQVIHRLAPELAVVDGNEDYPRIQAILADEAQRVVVIARELGDALALIGGREFVQIQRAFAGPGLGYMNGELEKDVEHAYGRRTVEETLTTGLRKWAEAEKIAPADFARKMGYSYQHAYNLLRGKTDATDDTLGRLARCYGTDVVNQILASASPA